MNMVSRFTTYLLVTTMSIPAFAQQAGGGVYMQAGAGMAGAVQGCPNGGMTVPQDVQGALDDVKQRNRELEEVKTKVRKFESDKAKAESERDRAKDNLSDTVDGRWVEIFADHIDNEISCSSYKVFPGCGDGKTPSADIKGEAKSCARTTVKPTQGDTWNRICDKEQPGNISPSAACDEDAIYMKGIEGRGRAKCVGALQKYEAASAKVKKLEQQLALYGEDRLDRATDRVESAKTRFEQAYTQYQTEGTFCTACQTGVQQGTPERRFDWGTMLGATAVGGLVMALGYSQEKNRAAQNASLGFPTQNSYMSFLPGAAMILNGFYNASEGGVSRGGFTCGGGSMGGGGNFAGGALAGNANGGGGAFGYPPGFNGAGVPGGGIYLPGGNGYGNGMNGGGGLQVGGGFNPFGGAGGGNGGFNPYGNGGGFNPYGGGGGLQVGGGFNPYGNGGGGGFNPYGNGGLQAGGGFNPYGGQMGGGGGFNPYGGQMGGGGGFNPYGNQGGLGLEYQQQMMQQQMAMYQQQMEMQMRVQENALQRQRVASGLVQEMYGLQIRLQCVQSGANCGGSYIGSGISTGLGGSGSGALIPQVGVPGGGFSPTGASFAPVPGTNPGTSPGSSNGGYVR